MHLATLHLAPILAAEKSRVPFYIAGGVLVAWALIVSVGLGLRRADFPGTVAGQQAVMAISAALVLAALATAVITSGVSTKAVASSAPGGPAPSGSGPGAYTSGGGSSTPATSTPTGSPKATTPTGRTKANTPSRPPKATTGTPVPPSSPAAGAGASVLKLAAGPGAQLSYNTKQLSARAGSVTIELANASPLEHDVAIAQGGTIFGQTPVKTGPATLRLNLKPGTYTFYCSVPGHRQAGMEGTLTVS
jgi:plastocyanin